MTALELEQLIRTAFSGVKLGDGVSLLQADVMDRYGDGLSTVLPRVVSLDDVDLKRVARAMRNYWHQYL